MKVGDSHSDLLFVAVARAGDQTLVATYTVLQGDYRKQQYCDTVKSILTAPGFEGRVPAGSRLRLQDKDYSVTLLADDERLVYMVVTGSNYPLRVATQILNEVKQAFQPYASKALTARDNELNKKVKKVFSEITQRYVSVEDVDKIAAVQAKTEQVTVVMKKNIDNMLMNLDQTEKIQNDTEELNKAAGQFNRQANELKRREVWKNRKMAIVLAVVILLILAILIISIMKN